MKPTLSLPPSDELRRWIRQSLEQQEHVLATSNQGTILLFQQGDTSLIIKTPMGKGLVRYLRQKTLKREFKAYRQLRGVGGIPACYGFLDNRYLLLEYVSGKPYREAEIESREQFFEALLIILRNIHARDVAHGDLKSKSNLLVSDDQKPCVIDFGTAFRYKSGFHPINNWFFRMALRLDINAWVKHKYHGHYSNASAEDLAMLQYSWLEILVRKISGRPMDRVFGRSSESDDDSDGDSATEPGGDPGSGRGNRTPGS